MKKILFAMLLALPMSLFAQKVGHVNIDAVVQGMPEYATAQTELQNLGKQLQEEFQRKQSDLQTKSEAYDKDSLRLCALTVRKNSRKPIRNCSSLLKPVSRKCRRWSRPRWVRCRRRS